METLDNIIRNKITRHFNETWNLSVVERTSENIFWTFRPRPRDIVNWTVCRIAARPGETGNERIVYVLVRGGYSSMSQSRGPERQANMLAAAALSSTSQSNVLQHGTARRSATRHWGLAARSLYRPRHARTAQASAPPSMCLVLHSSNPERTPRYHTSRDTHVKACL